MFWAELLLRKHLLDPLVYSMGKRVEMLHRDSGSESERSRPLTRWSPRWSVRMRESDGFALDLGKEAVEKNQQVNFPDVVSYAYNDRSDFDLLEGDDTGEPLDFLDIDVIDTTWMINNVHFIRHNYFNLNQTLVRVVIIYMLLFSHVLTLSLCLHLYADRRHPADCGAQAPRSLSFGLNAHERQRLHFPCGSSAHQE